MFEEEWIDAFLLCSHDQFLGVMFELVMILSVWEAVKETCGNVKVTGFFISEVDSGWRALPMQWNLHIDG